MDDFPALFSAARVRSELTQAELAAKIGVSSATIASWESGRRVPSGSARGRDWRQVIIEACDVIRANADELNAMLEALEFSPVPPERVAPLLDRRKPLAVIRDECRSYPWVSLAMNEDFEVVAWNEAANDLSELDFATDLAAPGERNLLRMALSRHYREKLVNWEEVIGIMVAMWKTAKTDLFSQETTPYFRNLFDFVITNHQAELQMLLTLWNETAPFVEGQSGEWQAQWRTSDGTALLFNNRLSAWSEFDGVSAFDWQPANAETWEWMEARRRGREAAAERTDAETEQPEAASAREIFRFGREKNGFSRRALAQRAGVSEQLVYAYERGTKSLSRERLIQIAASMVLDQASLNAILQASGFEPEPSKMMDYILGYDVSASPRFVGAPERRHWTPDTIQTKLAEYAWPALVVGDHCDLLAMNDVAGRVLGVEFSKLPAGPARNLMAIVTDAPFRAVVQNWAEAVTNVLPGYLEPYIAPPGSEVPGAKADEDVQRVIRYVGDREKAAGRTGDPLHELLAAWRGKPKRRLTARVSFVLDCLHDGQALRFNAIIRPWNAMLDPYWAIELHPADAATWRALG